MPGRMMRRLALAIALGLGGAGAARAADAPVIKVTDEMPDAVLRAELEQVGFGDAQDIRRDGDTITATARHDGQRVRLAIDARTGIVRIIR